MKELFCFVLGCASTSCRGFTLTLNDDDVKSKYKTLRNSSATYRE